MTERETVAVNKQKAKMKLWSKIYLLGIKGGTSPSGSEALADNAVYAFGKTF